MFPYFNKFASGYIILQTFFIIYFTFFIPKYYSYYTHYNKCGDLT